MAEIHSRCRIPNCKNNSSNYKGGFFRFPKDYARASLWAEFCGIELEQNIKTENIRICGAHFRADMFTKSVVKRRLKQDAYPVLFNDLQAVTDTLETRESDGQVSTEDAIVAIAGTSTMENCNSMKGTVKTEYVHQMIHVNSCVHQDNQTSASLLNVVECIADPPSLQQEMTHEDISNLDESPEEDIYILGI